MIYATWDWLVRTDAHPVAAVALLVVGIALWVYFFATRKP